MYWVDNGDGTYDCLDGQQREPLVYVILLDGISSFNAPWLNDNKKTYIHTLKRTNPDLLETF